MRGLPTVLSDKELRDIITGQSPFITSESIAGIADDQIQSSSLDLTIGHEVYGMGTATLPQQGQNVADLLKGSQYQFVLEPGQPGFLHRGYTYIVPLNERMALPPGFSAKFSPKSSTGRTDVFVRVMADGVSQFNNLPDGYKGRLYLEITSLSFQVRIQPGLPLVQMRIKAGDSRLSGTDVAIAHSQKGIFLDRNSVAKMSELRQAEHGIYLHADLDRNIVGFTSRSNAMTPLSLFEKDEYDPFDFWEPIRRPRDFLTIDPNRFYLFATKERLRVPTDLCADMAAYDDATGEFRTHYAGFFDPGFGGEHGTVAVLEVRGREIPHRVYDNSPFCLMVFERVSPVLKPYRGHYLDGRPSLSKHFKDRYEVWE